MLFHYFRERGKFNLIPKIIHYCWFGKKDKPEIVKKCIQSWKKYLPNYEIIEWNEGNFDINDHLFTKQAYELGNYAFVSDYVRVYALYEYGGIYLDTDTEILASLDEFLSQDSIWGFEEKNFIATSFIGAKKKNPLIKEFLDYYQNLSLVNEDGSIKQFTNVLVVTELLQKRDVRLDGTFQQIEGIATIYPQEYFSPYDYINCYLKKTDKTVAIHHFYKSWLPLTTRMKGSIKKGLALIIGGHRIAKLREVFVNR